MWKCENYHGITDVLIQKEIEGTNNIIIKVIYNDLIEEKKLLINGFINCNNLIVNWNLNLKKFKKRYIWVYYDKNRRKY